MLVAVWTLCPAQAQPTLSPPVLSNDLVHAQLTLSNCTNTGFQYILQTSSDLINWTNVLQTVAVFTTQSVTVPTTNQQAFYRLLAAPLFSYAIVAKSNVIFSGNNLVVDSFDSSNPLYSTDGQYDVSKRKANGNVATDSPVTNAISVGNANIYGIVMTGPGTTQNAVAVGPDGAVGDIAWNTNDRGIESNYWSGNFGVNIPDVNVPYASFASLPAASNGVIYLNSSFSPYLATSDPAKPIVISGPVVLWVTTSYSPQIGFASNDPGAALTLYVGAPSGANTSLSLNGNSVTNYPGYAKNLQIYGLPTLTTVNLSGSATFVGTIYAPEAAVTGTGGGTNLGSVGAVVANSVKLISAWSVHYDESLATGNGF